MEIAFFWILFYIDMRFIHDNSRQRNKKVKYMDVLFFKDKIVIFKHFSRKNHNFQGKIKN